MSRRCPLCHGHVEAPVSAAWRFFVAEQPPSQNSFKSGAWPPQHATLKQLRRLMIAKATAYTNLVKRWQKLLRGPAATAGITAAEGEDRRRITFTRLMSSRHRHMDHGNLVGGCKAVVDACVHIDLLVDDSAKHFEGYYHQRRATEGEEPGLLVHVEELVVASPGQPSLPL